MKYGIIFISITITLATVITVGFLSANIMPVQNDRIQVAATIFPLADIIQNVAGDTIDVELVLTPGASPHTFELTPNRAVDLANVQHVFAIGHGLDDWATGIADISSSTVTTLDQRANLMCDNDTCDPHYWLSAPNAVSITNQIVDELSLLDPDNTDTYRSNADNYIIELEQLDSEIRNTTSQATNTSLLTFHDSFTYFAEEYGYTIRGTFEPAPGREPTPRQLAELQELVSIYNIGTLFTEPQLSQSTVNAFVNDLQVAIMTVDPLGGTGQNESYIELMQYNANTFTQAR